MKRITSSNNTYMITWWAFLITSASASGKKLSTGLVSILSVVMSAGLQWRKLSLGQGRVAAATAAYLWLVERGHATLGSCLSCRLFGVSRSLERGDDDTPLTGSTSPVPACRTLKQSKKKKLQTNWASHVVNHIKWKRTNNTKWSVS